MYARAICNCGCLIWTLQMLRFHTSLTLSVSETPLLLRNVNIALVDETGCLSTSVYGVKVCGFNDASEGSADLVKR